jgi:hypothetical protein
MMYAVVPDFNLFSRKACGEKHCGICVMGFLAQEISS